MKAKRKKTKKEEAMLLREPAPLKEVIHEHKPHIIREAVIAVVVLIGAISLINLLKNPSITGAVITAAEIERNFNFTILMTVVIIVLTIGVYEWGKKKFH